MRLRRIGTDTYCTFHSQFPQSYRFVQYHIRIIVSSFLFAETSTNVSEEILCQEIIYIFGLKEKQEGILEKRRVNPNPAAMSFI